MFENVKDAIFEKIQQEDFDNMYLYQATLELTHMTWHM